MHCSNLVYHYKKDLTEDYDDYGGETKCRIGKRIKDHRGADKNSTIYRNNISKNLPLADKSEFTIVAKNYPHNTKRKIAEALFIREKKPTLNKQTESFKLNLLN